jgi:hypothetical protein
MPMAADPPGRLAHGDLLGVGQHSEQAAADRGHRVKRRPPAQRHRRRLLQTQGKQPPGQQHQLGDQPRRFLHDRQALDLAAAIGVTGDHRAAVAADDRQVVKVLGRRRRQLHPVGRVVGGAHQSAGELGGLAAGAGELAGAQPGLAAGGPLAGAGGGCQAVIQPAGAELVGVAGVVVDRRGAGGQQRQAAAPAQRHRGVAQIAGHLSVIDAAQ